MDLSKGFQGTNEINEVRNIQGNSEKSVSGKRGSTNKLTSIEVKHTFHLPEEGYLHKHGNIFK